MVVRELLACTQPNRHETFTVVWNPYRRVSSRGQRAQIRFIRGAYVGIRDRALRICDSTSRQPEMEHLTRLFEANGFPERLVRKTLTKPRRQQTRETEEEEPLKTRHLPYV